MVYLDLIMEYLLFILVITIALIIALIWFAMISILKDNKYKVNIFSLGSQVNIIINFFLLIIREKNGKLKMKYLILYVLFILCIILFCFSALYSLSFT